MVEQFKFSEEEETETEDQCSADSVRFAYSISMNAYINQGEEEGTFQACSLLYDNIKNTPDRDVLFSIARESPAFNMLQMVKNQKSLFDLM